ncbi:MAG: hypothetical protein WC974_02205 [Thermoplasmata archaeon]
MQTKSIISILLLVLTVILIVCIAFVFFKSSGEVKEIQMSLNENPTAGLNITIFTKTDDFGTAVNCDVNVSITYNNQTVYNSTVRVKNNICTTSIKYEDFYRLNGDYTITAKYKDKSAEKKIQLVKTIDYIGISATKNDDGQFYDMSLSFSSNMSSQPYRLVVTKGYGVLSIFYNASGSNETKLAYASNYTLDNYELNFGSKKYSITTGSVKINYSEFVSMNNNGTYLVCVNFTNNLGSKTDIISYDLQRDEWDEIELLPDGKNI